MALVIRPTSDRALVDWALSLGLALYLGGLMQFYFPLRRLPTDVPGFWVLALLDPELGVRQQRLLRGWRDRPHPAGAHASAPTSRSKARSPAWSARRSSGRCSGWPLGLPPLLMAGYGVSIALATIVGDLVESLIKRQTGVKDSGILIPGHGGLLDRMDSLLFCAPIAVLYLHAFAA